MRVYDWKTLLATTLVGGGSFIYQFVRFDEFLDLIWLGIFATILIKGIYVSLFKEAHDNYIKRLALEKRVSRKLFGKIAPIMPYSPYIFLVLICIVTMGLPDLEWLLVGLLILNLIYTIWLCITLRRNIRIEETQEFLRDLKTKKTGESEQSSAGNELNNQNTREC